MSNQTLHFRAESKPLEHRSAITPTTAKQLVEAGYTVFIERSELRIFDAEEYEKTGARLVPYASWMDAPDDTIIIGLKELPEADKPLIHTHIFFGHAFKGQSNASEILSRFVRGGGNLLDMEYLEDSNGRRVAAFGYVSQDPNPTHQLPS